MGKRNRKRKRKQEPVKAHRRKVLRSVRKATVGVGLVKAEKERQKLMVGGTGFIVNSQQGMILTARHVVDGLIEKEKNDEKWCGSYLGVLLYQPPAGSAAAPAFTFIVAHEVVKNNKHDVAVITVRGHDLRRRGLTLNYDMAPEEGDMAGTCGWPHGLDKGIGGLSTFLLGPISSVLPSPQAGPTERDAYNLQMPATQGNSGGPVFELDTGQVFGLVTAKITVSKYSTGLTQALPIRFVRGVADPPVVG